MSLLNRIKNAILRGYSYSTASKLSLVEIAIIIVSILLPIIYYINNTYLILIYISIVISMILSIKDKYFEKNKVWSNFYRNSFFAILSLQFLNIIVLFVFSKEFEIMGLITLSLGLINYLFLSVSLIIFILNIVFWIILKFIFPFETTDELKMNDVPLKELSKYMSLNDQFIYFTIMILHFLMRQGIAIYMYLLALIYSRSTQENKGFLKFIEKIESLEIVSVGNFLGLSSILIAIATVTLQGQVRIEKSAYEGLNQDKVN